MHDLHIQLVYCAAGASLSQQCHSLTQNRNNVLLKQKLSIYPQESTEMKSCLGTVCNHFRVRNVDVLDAVYVQSGDQMEPGTGRNITLGLQPLAIQEHHIALQHFG